jgi:hypothetical protein
MFEIVSNFAKPDSFETGTYTKFTIAFRKIVTNSFKRCHTRF